MMLNTSLQQPVDIKLMQEYFSKLVNKFFKILPMMENGEKSIETYIESLQVELLGCKDLIAALNYDPLYLSLLGILEWLRINIYDDSFSFKRKRREIFNAISVCKKLEIQYLQVIEPLQEEVK